ncbi:hypothetical protein LPJ53_002787 [Coemansia erecta]|uniref:COPI associated n=1 Tax=Coemansia erecta TaxID=147472 RepID=A0A9W8CT49_9FUNG|nr:hypothetical protein LPJ53_002787 [Coemansia erecta]
MALPYLVARRPFAFSRYLTLPLLLVNAAQGVLIFVQGCLSCSIGDVRHVMLGILCIFAGFLLVLMEIVHLAAFRMYASFLFSFFGRGLFYVILGCLTVEGAGRPAELGIGVEVAIVGAVFLGVSLNGRVYFDDPEDEHAAVIHNMQHGYYGRGSGEGTVQGGGGGLEKSIRTMGAYSGPQGRSETLSAYTASSMASASASATAAGGGRGFTAERLPISNPL